MNLVCNKRCIHGVPRSVMFFYPPWVHVLIEMGRGHSRVRTIFYETRSLFNRILAEACTEFTLFLQNHPILFYKSLIHTLISINNYIHTLPYKIYE